MSRIIATALTLVCMTGAAQAATISETDFSGGFAAANQNFMPNYTQIGTGFDQVNGTSSANNFDFIQFENLNAGAQTVTLTFNMLTPNTNAGGEVRYSTVQTTGPYTGNQSAGNLSLSAGNDLSAPSASQTLSFSLDNSFAGGPLFVNILQTFGGSALSYSVLAPGNAPAPVPLPPAGILLVSAIGLLALRRRARAGDLHLGTAEAT